MGTTGSSRSSVKCIVCTSTDIYTLCLTSTNISVNLNAWKRDIDELNEEIKRWKKESNENTVGEEAELAQLKIERADLKTRYKYLKGLIIFMLLFGVIALVYHVKIMIVTRAYQHKMWIKSE